MRPRLISLSLGTTFTLIGSEAATAASTSSIVGVVSVLSTIVVAAVWGRL